MRNYEARTAGAKMSILKTSSRPLIKERSDRNGTVISRDNKAYKISFADNITNEKEKIADVYVVESYKRFNAENTHGS